MVKIEQTCPMIMYSYDDVIEILRWIIFEGTPWLYDQGGVNKNYNLSQTYTTARAKDAFEKYYVNRKIPTSG